MPKKKTKKKSKPKPKPQPNFTFFKPMVWKPPMFNGNMYGV